MIDDKGKPILEPSVHEHSTNSNNNNIPDKKDPSGLLSNITRRGRGHLNRKYGLRPRNGLRRPIIEQESPEFRPTFRGRIRGGRSGPLSKYRRKTANARERHRMKEINDAFSTLREALPRVNTRRTTITGMTKITTLRMAVNYIQVLSDILNGENIVPTEATVALLNSSNLWSSCSHEGQVKTEKEEEKSTCNMRHNDSSASKFTDLHPMLIEADYMSSNQKPGWESSHTTDSDFVNMLDNSDCIIDNSLPNLDDFPQFPDFCWSLS